MDAGTLLLIGQGIQAGSKIAGGIHAQRAADYNAAAMERQATDEIAAAQRVAMERRLDTDRLISKQVALGAASGAGAGPSLLDIIGDTAQAGEYRAQADMYAGESRAATLRERARLTKAEGRSAFIGSILEGVGGMALAGAQSRLKYGSTTGSSMHPGTRVSSMGPLYG